VTTTRTHRASDWTGHRQQGPDTVRVTRHNSVGAARPPPSPSPSPLFPPRGKRTHGCHRPTAPARPHHLKRAGGAGWLEDRVRGAGPPVAGPPKARRWGQSAQRTPSPPAHVCKTPEGVRRRVSQHCALQTVNGARKAAPTPTVRHRRACVLPERWFTEDGPPLPPLATRDRG
jgi:hypothetical protein